MKTAIRNLLCATFVLLPLTAVSGGSEGGGGGSDEARIFQRVARQVAEKLTQNRSTFKYGSQLLETLSNPLEVVVMETLAYACDGRATSTHWAYSCRGKINLLASRWANRPVGEGRLKSELLARANITDIIHEVFRAGDPRSRLFVTNDGANSVTEGRLLEPILSMIAADAVAEIRRERSQAANADSESRVIIAFKPGYAQKNIVSSSSTQVVVKYTNPTVTDETGTYLLNNIIDNDNVENFCLAMAKENQVASMSYVSHTGAGDTFRFFGTSRGITARERGNSTIMTLNINRVPAARALYVSTLVCLGTR